MHRNPPGASAVLPPANNCTPLLSGVPLDPRQADRLAATLRVLGDPARLRLLSLIAAQLDSEACVCHLTESLDLAQPTVSHHLKVLFQAGLVTRERRGTWIYYRIAPDALRQVRALFGEQAATNWGPGCDCG